MTAFYTAAGGDRRRLPAAASGSAGAAQGFRRAPRVGPPPVLSAGAAPVPVPEAPRPARVGRPVSQQQPSCPPPVRRDPVRHGILWSPELMDWLYQCRSSGVAVAVLARALGCTTQTVFTQFRRDPRGIPGAPLPVQPGKRISPREFARWGRGRAEDMPAEVLAREVSRRQYPPVGPLTRLFPRHRIGRPLDLADDPDWEGDAGT